MLVPNICQISSVHGNIGCRFQGSCPEEPLRNVFPSPSMEVSPFHTCSQYPPGLEQDLPFEGPSQPNSEPDKGVSNPIFLTHGRDHISSEPTLSTNEIHGQIVESICLYTLQPTPQSPGVANYLPHYGRSKSPGQYKKLPREETSNGSVSSDGICLTMSERTEGRVSRV